MLTRVQADLIATAIRVVRPAWAYNELMKTLAHDDIRNRRGYADTFHALLALALDSATNHPNRLLSAGPWWSIRTSTDTPRQHFAPIDPVNGCHECMAPKDDHRARDHEYLPPQPVVPHAPTHVRQHLNERNDRS